MLERRGGAELADASAAHRLCVDGVGAAQDLFPRLPATQLGGAAAAVIAYAAGVLVVRLWRGARPERAERAAADKSLLVCLSGR